MPRSPRLTEAAQTLKPSSRSTPPDKVETTRMSLYLDADDVQELRRDAFDAAVPVNSLVVAAVRLYMSAPDRVKVAVVEEAREVTRERRAFDR